VPKSRLQLLFGSRNSGSIVAVIAAAAMPECSGEPPQAAPENATRRNTALRHTPVFAGQELDLICNNNFV